MKYKLKIGFEFKKILLKIIIPYFSIIILIGFSINYLFEEYIVFKSEISGAYKVNRILNETHSNEIVIIGSSRARGGVVPEIIAENVFNYGIDGTGYNYINFILEIELKKEKTTPIFIVFDYEWDKLGIGSIQYYISNSTQPEVSELFKGHFSLNHYIPFIKYFGYYEENLKYFLNNKLNYSKYNNKGGSFELFENSKKMFDIYVQKRKGNEITFPSKNITKLNNLLEGTQRKIILFILPYHVSYLKNITNKENILKFQNDFKEYKNVEVLDYSNVELADSMYFNTTHLNYKGAKYISKKIKIDLDSLHVLN